jgi:uncharacterized membrane protein
MGNGAFGGYLSLFGFVLLVIGILVAYSSVGMIQQNSFNSDYSTLSNASIILLIGAMVGVAGAALLLIGFLSAKRELRHPYY